ncbi:MAG: hypothetical protein HY067_11125 [Betaproteobacteria bacterium]|nr:hypothetical protein [Betaproteobacteria bacterium]
MRKIKIKNLFILLVSAPSCTLAIADDQKESLQLIKDFAKEMCSSIPLESTKSEIKLKGDAQAKLTGVIKKLADLGASGAVDYSSQKAQGVLQSDLAKALSDANNCRLHIFDTLEKKLLHRNPVVNQPKPVKNKSDRPEETAVNGTINFSSEAGDYIGGGKSMDISDENAKLSAIATDRTVSVHIRGDDDWNIIFEAPEGKRLVVGAYELAQRAPFHNPVKPGLEISGAGRGCNTLAGRFDIRAITFSKKKALELFDAEFEQHCEGNSPALRGRIQIKARSNS